MILDTRDCYTSHMSNMNLLVRFFRVYENKKRVETSHKFKQYRLLLQNGGVLTDRMIEHILKFLRYELDQPIDEIRTVLSRFKKKPVEPDEHQVTLDQFFE